VAIRSDPDGGENCCVADDTIHPDFLVAGIKDQISDLSERTVAPPLKVVIQKPAGAADL
jgi:hypothetical protein